MIVSYYGHYSVVEFLLSLVSSLVSSRIDVGQCPCWSVGREQLGNQGKLNLSVPGQFLSPLSHHQHIYQETEYWVGENIYIFFYLLTSTQLRGVWYCYWLVGWYTSQPLVNSLPDVNFQWAKFFALLPSLGFTTLDFLRPKEISSSCRKPLAPWSPDWCLVSEPPGAPVARNNPHLGALKAPREGVSKDEASCAGLQPDLRRWWLVGDCGQQPPIDGRLCQRNMPPMLSAHCQAGQLSQRLTIILQHCSDSADF